MDDNKSFTNNGYTLDTNLFGPANEWSLAQNGSSFMATFNGPSGVTEPSSMVVIGLALA